MKVTHDTTYTVELNAAEVSGIISEIDNIFKKYVAEGLDPKEIEGLLTLKGNIVVNMEL